jgi:hypothetical protein
LIAGLLTVLAVLVLPVAALAVVPVTIQTDEQDGECAMDCSLRDAVLIAGGSGDTVQVPAGTYSLSLGELTVGNVTIQGSGAGATVIQAGTNARALLITGSATINGVTVTGGNPNVNSGGGIEVGNGQTVTLRLNDSAVTGNQVVQVSQGYGGGIMVNSQATLLMTSTTVSGNHALGGDGDGIGGGIFVDGSGRAELRNSTVSGNLAEQSFSVGVGGGIGVDAASTLVMENVTVAANTAGTGGGIGVVGTAAITISSSIVAGNAVEECSGPITHTGGYNLADDATCGLIAVGDRPNTNPQLGPLQVNTGSGRTATHALPPSSAAVNAGDPAACKPTDQRGAPRPAGACDVGAFEYVAPTLTVTTTVTNNDGGEDRPADFSVRVTSGGADVAGSPQPGTTTGTTYTLTPGTFDVSADGPNLYTTATGGACAADGTVTLGENQAATCTVTANDRPPVAGRSVGVIPARGTVRVKRPGGKFRVLREGDLLPNGTTIDTLRGRVTLIAAANKRGKESKADFYDGIFRFRQSKGRRPITTLTLTERLRCPKAGSASAAAKRKKKRRLWGNGSGRFRTKGKHSAATVVGTKWLVEDRCTNTLTRVVRGRVSVRDFELKKTVIVKRGKRYIARAE